MQHQMKLASEPFNKIVRKEKVIESRLCDKKRQQIALGDEIIFSENDHPENSVRTKVVGLFKHSSFQDLFKNHEAKLFGGGSAESLLKEIKQFYAEEDEQKCGVLGIQMEVIG